ncbi:hypothetical protein ROZALSC1DRAFT_27360 [Rozella allomycis CSF55]|uniref:Mitochondrial import inner membrane translocase subunit n=1 Tax=Rozella allomycis (strain CSF55) TaxID=988480 RepID=A0A075B1T6_ROZAC|nr:hypothetical protein O9G_004751 [Rozella allomycis CSF55]RKP21208.1 hypothetical protein ROZALSC1DRAFT_27357 [Rozella allomycis CSF55]RKP21214.1 hypothetical protein ROZALSC1DRAFT_27360 [Rozella allomycis CSF55]|eukprot:EPZ36323.1 hypothetical protein O9G_004751 [Rozella allomycis CSF55]
MFWGSSSNNGPSEAQKKAINEVHQQITAAQAVFDRVFKECHLKCVNSKHPAEEELTKGESVCTDRCVSKYFEAVNKISLVVQNFAEEQQKIMAEQMQTQTA